MYRGSNAGEQMKRMKILSMLVLILALSMPAFAKRDRGGSGPNYGGGHHTKSHGGHYQGEKNSHHKGGHYKNPKTSNKYGKHKP
jgi:hypothetical protein